MDEINKMFEVWLEQHKKDCGNDTFTNRELNGYKDAWNAACEMMRGKVNQKDNEIRTVRAIAEGMCKEIDQANKTIQDLQQKLDKAVEIIKVFKLANWNDTTVYDKAEQFLSTIKEVTNK